MAEVRRVRTVSALLVNPDSKLVIQLRDDKPGLLFPNCWSTLGGAIDPGETPEAAMRRELIEEIEFCPPLCFWKTVELQNMFGDVLVVSEVSAFIGQLDRDISAINLREGQRLGAFAADEIDGLACAFGLEKLFRDFFAERPDRALF